MSPSGASFEGYFLPFLRTRLRLLSPIHSSKNGKAQALYTAPFDILRVVISARTNTRYPFRIKPWGGWSLLLITLHVWHPWKETRRLKRRPMTSGFGILWLLDTRKKLRTSSSWRSEPHHVRCQIWRHSLMAVILLAPTTMYGLDQVGTLLICILVVKSIDRNNSRLTIHAEITHFAWSFDDPSFIATSPSISEHTTRKTSNKSLTLGQLTDYLVLRVPQQSFWSRWLQVFVVVSWVVPSWRLAPPRHRNHPKLQRSFETIYRVI